MIDWLRQRRRRGPTTGVVVAALFFGGTRVVAQQSGSQQVGVRGSVITGQDSLAVIRSRVDSLLGVLARTSASAEYAQARETMLELLRDAAFGGGGGTSRLFVSASISNAFQRDPDSGMRMLSAIMPKGWLGFTLDAYSTEQLSEDGQVLRYAQYPSVVAVEPNSPAERAGIVVQDTVVAFNDMDLRNGAINLTQLEEPGRVLKVQIIRDGQSRTFSMHVEAAPPGYAQNRLRKTDSLVADLVATSVPSSPRIGPLMPPPSVVNSLVFVVPVPGAWGASLMELNSESGKPFGATAGLLVNSADSGTPAFKMGLRQWDVILQVDKRPITTYDDFRMALRQHPSDKPIEMLVLRDHTKKVLALNPGG